jgi:hypothetical protein
MNPQTELDKLIKKLNLPSNLSYQQMQEIALYAAHKLEEQKSKKEKIIFNPVDNNDPLKYNQPAKSDANVSHLKYKLGNRKRS